MHTHLVGNALHEDQASGLRRLAARHPKALRLSWIWSSSPQICIPEVLRHCRGLRERGAGVLLLDAIDGHLLRHFGAAPRYDLAQVLDGHTTLDQAANWITTDVSMISVNRLMRRHESGKFAFADIRQPLPQWRTCPSELVLAGGRASPGLMRDLVITRGQLIITLDHESTCLVEAYRTVKLAISQGLPASSLTLSALDERAEPMRQRLLSVLENFLSQAAEPTASL